MGTMVYQYGLLAPVEGEELVRAQMRAGHRYYNALVEADRVRERETEAFWAERGGYQKELLAFEEATEAARKVPKDLPKEEREAVYERERAARDLVARLRKEAIRSAQGPEEQRRADRAKEVTAERKARGEPKLSAAEMAALLDKESDCVSPRRAAQLAFEHRSRERGVENVSAKAMTAELRNAGLVKPTDAIDEKAKAAAKTARETLGIIWHNSHLVDAAFEQAKAKRAALGRRDVMFKAYDGSGRVGVEIGKLPAERVHDEGNTLLRIDTVAQDAWSPNAQRGERRRAQRTRVALRVGSDAKKKPVWAVFPMIMHRPLPPGSLVTGAVVTVRRVGTMERWQLNVTVATDDPRPLVAREETVAVNIGWRRLKGDAVRVAYWVGSDGGEGQVVLPNRARERFRKVSDLKEIQELSFSGGKERDGMLFTVASWLSEQPTEALPEWMREELGTMTRWRSQGRLSTFVRRWAAERIAGDEEIFAEAEAWRRQVRHLYQWESCQRKSTALYRREVYRVAASDLARRYGTALLVSVDLAKTKQRKKLQPGELRLVEDSMRSQMHEAAPGEFTSALANAFRSRGGVVIKARSEDATTGCHACGQKCQWDRIKQLEHTCEHCGANWDQDQNACENALKGAGCERPRGAAGSAAE